MKLLIIGNIIILAKNYPFIKIIFFKIMVNFVMIVVVFILNAFTSTHLVA